jgi:hypothetical protein
MPRSNLDMIYRLQVALNSKGIKALINRSQFYSEERNRPVTIYKVSIAQFDEESGRTKNVEVFSSASQIQIVLFLRNFWNLVQGKPIPPTNGIKGAAQFEEKWEQFEESWKYSHLEE